MILRRLNISIQDIGRIFRAFGFEIVLDVLGEKVGDIDEEISLLHELKEIVLDFIRQIEKADFGKDSDVKLLYEKAKEIKTQLVNVDCNGNPAAVNFRSASSLLMIRYIHNQKPERISVPVFDYEYIESSKGLMRSESSPPRDSRYSPHLQAAS